MKDHQLEAQIASIMSVETENTMYRVDCPDGKVRLIGFPKETHWQYGKIVCYTWAQKGPYSMAPYNALQHIPEWFVNVKIPSDDFSEEQMALAEEIIRGK